MLINKVYVMRKLILHFFMVMLFIPTVSFAQWDYTCDFDSIDDYIALPAYYNGSGAIQELTVTAWVKALPNEGGWSVIDFDRSEYFNLEIGWNDRSTDVVNFATTGTNATIHDMAGTTNVRDGYWHFIAAVFDGTNKYIYVDGNLDATATNPHGGLDIGTGTTRYGFIGDGSEATTFNGTRNNFYFGGQIEEVSVWHATKTLTELNDIMNNGIPSPMLEPNLFVYYKFDDGSGQVLTDSGPNGYDGQLGASSGNDNADPIWVYTDTDYDQYTFDFDGSNDYVHIPNSADINSGGPYPSRTIEVWFFCDDITPSGKQVIYEEGGTVNGFNIYITNGVLYGGGYAESNSWAGTYHSTSMISSQTWHHVAIVLDNGGTSPSPDKFKAYLDGVEFGSGPGAQLPAHGGDIAIGRRGDAQFHDGDVSGSGNYFNGKIEEFRMWDDARTVDEIRMEMHRELLSPSTEPNLIAYFRFNEAIGRILNDLSGSSNHGKFYNTDYYNDWTPSTAPLPYYTVQNGNWDTDVTWAAGQMAPDHAWARVAVGHAVSVVSNEEVEEMNVTGSLSIESQYSMTVNGNLANSSGSAGIVVQADATGMGSLIHNTAGIDGTVEQYVTEEQWHFVSPPVSNAVSGVYTNLYLIDWSEADSAWNFIVPVSVPLNVGNGYGVFASSGLTGTTTVSYQGMLNTGDKSPAITFNDNPGEGHGWNLVGNPYPSSIEWNTNWATTSVDATIYVWDGVQYLTWNRNTLIGTKANGVVPVSQGFFIKANAASPSITIPESDRMHSNEGFYKASEGVLRLRAEGNGYSDEAIVQLANGATNGFDTEFDAYKIMGLADAPQLYSVSSGNNLTVNSISPAGIPEQINMAFEVGNEGYYTITMIEDPAALWNVKIWLKDLKENKQISFNKEKMYSFYAHPDDDPLRFALVFAFEAPAMDEPFTGGNTENIYTSGNEIVITSAEGGQAYIYSALGQLVSLERMNPGKQSVAVPEKGLYLVKMVENGKAETHKVFVR